MDCSQGWVNMDYEGLVALGFCLGFKSSGFRGAGFRGLGCQVKASDLAPAIQALGLGWIPPPTQQQLDKRYTISMYIYIYVARNVTPFRQNRSILGGGRTQGLVD